MPYTPPKATFKAEGLFVQRIGETQVISDKFSKRELVLTDNAEKYPTILAIQFQRKECGKADLVRVGDLVDVYGELRGREWNGRYFVDVVAHEIHRVESGAAPAAPTAQARQPDHIQPSAAQSDLSDQLPF